MLYVICSRIHPTIPPSQVQGGDVKAVDTQLSNWQEQCPLSTTGRRGAQDVFVNWLTERGYHIGFHVFKRSRTVFSPEVASSFCLSAFQLAQGGQRQTCFPASNWHSLEVTTLEWKCYCIGLAQEEHPSWFAWDRPHLSTLQDNYH